MSNTLNALKILDILKENSDKQHPMRIVDIAKRMNIRPRTVGDILEMLHRYDKRVIFDFNGKKSENPHRTGVHYDHEFEASELRLLIDMLMFSKLLTKKQTTDLINKLKGLNSKHFKKYADHSLEAVEAPDSNNNEVLENIGNLTQAIKEHKKVCFDFAVYNFKTNKDDEIKNDVKNPRLLSEKKEERLVVTPIYMLYTEGKYFLVCKFPTRDKLYHYRIDKIKKVSVLDEKGDDFKPKSLGEYARKHFNSFSGTSESITFYADEIMKNKIIDAFGADINLCTDKDGRPEFCANVSREAFKQWAIANCETVEVKSPTELRGDLAKIFKSAAEKYEREIPKT